MVDLYNGEFSINSLIQLIGQFLIQRRMWTLWFLTTLFALNILYYVLIRVLKTEKRMAIATLFFSVAGIVYYKRGGGPLPWNIDVCLTAFPFFFAGDYLKQNTKSIFAILFDIDSKNNLLYLFLFLMINVFCVNLSWCISREGFNMYECTYGLAPLTFLAAFSGIACIIILAKLFTIKPILYIGQNSLPYLAWHQTIMIPISYNILTLCHFVINDQSPYFMIATYKFIQFFIIIGIITVINYCIKKTKLDFILGK